MYNNMIDTSIHEVDPDFYSRMLQPSRTRSGIPPVKSMLLEKRRISRNYIMNPYSRIFNTQCIQSTDEKYYYIHLDPYETAPITIKVIDEVSPLLENPTKFESGAYYTYIIASIVGKNIKTNKTEILSPFPAQLYATKAVNMYEFGTKHQQIFHRMAVKDETLFKELEKTHVNIEYILYASGEIKCIEQTLVFNFYSGTYKMKKHMIAKRLKYEEVNITYMMQNFAPTYKIQFQYCSFINQAVLPLTTHEIWRLKTYNIRLFAFDTEPKCRYMRYAVINHKNDTKIGMTDEELDKAYIKHSQ
jgi:hypothetical protein